MVDAQLSGRRPLTRLLPALVLLGLAGIALRIPILAMPPIVPVIHDDFHMSETQVGLLIGLPLGLFALAAVPGSLFVARFGAGATLLTGMLIATVASAARGFAPSLWLLYATSILVGLGVAVMQPALPRLVREWVPERIGLGTAVYSNGMLIGACTPIAFTYSVVMPLVDKSWRTDLIVWAIPVGVIAIVFAIALPFFRTSAPPPQQSMPSLAHWWPDWKSSLTWMLGLTFASNNSMYFALNAVLPDFLTETGRGELIGTVLLWLNLAQLAALFALLWAADRLLHRAWPYLVFGPMAFFGVIGMAYLDGVWLVIASIVVGAATAITFGTILALPPALSRPDDVHRTAAGTFTIAYACAVVVPICCGALWDLTGIPRSGFVPVALCAVGLTVFGASMSRYRPAAGGIAARQGA